MKRYLGLFIVLGLLVLIIGCGGGGGGGGTSGSGSGSGGGGGGGGGSSSGSITSPQVTAYLPSGAMIDTRNLVIGQTIQLDITGRNSSDDLVVVPTTGWSTTAPSSIAKITSGGQLTTYAATGTTTYSITVIYGGVSYSVNLAITAQQDIVTGTVSNGTNGVESAIVYFYNASNAQVGVAYTTRSGTFQASVPPTATQFTVNTSLADPGQVYYYLQYAYDSEQYLEVQNGVIQCLAPLPTLSASAPTALPSSILLDLESAGPPPPPTGCVG